MEKNRTWLYALLGFVIGALTVVLGVTIAGNMKQRVTEAKWQKLNFILQQVEDNYVDTVDRKAVTDAAISAALQKLDPHSQYMLPEPLKEADENLAGGFEGVGLQFNVPNDTAVVIDVIAGGPSEKAGLLGGDRILKVNDRTIAGNKTPQDTMVHLMRGPKGTKVTLTIGRGKEKIPFEIIRDKIPEHCIATSFMIDDTTGYVRLSKFSRTTTMEFLEASLALKEKGMTSLVFDLRANSGGYFDQAANLANLFLPKDAMIVYMQGLHRRKEETLANGKGCFQDLGLSVLIDDGSASASEIFAGAMQDNDRGLIVGRRSYGKGLVQEPIYFTDGSGIRLTVSRFYTPSGRCIQKPYADDYAYDVYNRYISGEMVSADSIKVDSTQIYKTVKGRTVYGGGGIIPDVFVPIDTTKATKFHIACNNKAVIVRYASAFLDSHREKLLPISDFQTLDTYLKGCNLEAGFLAYAASLGIRPSSSGEWAESKPFIMPQVMGLCGRYSKVGEEAYFRYIMPIDTTIQAALGNEAQ